MSEKEQPSIPKRSGSNPILLAILDLKSDLDDRHGQNVKAIQDLQNDFNKLIKGFPSGDLDGHRRAHEVMIKKAEESTAFWRELRVKLAEKGIWAVVMFVAAAIGWYLTDRMKR